MPLSDEQAQKVLRDFGLKVDSLMRDKFQSKEAMVKATGFSMEKLEAILEGKGDPKLSTILQLARIFEIAPNEFFSRL